MVECIFTCISVLELIFYSVSHLVYRIRYGWQWHIRYSRSFQQHMTRSRLRPFAHLSYIAVTRWYIGYVTVIHNVFLIYRYRETQTQTHTNNQIWIWHTLAILLLQNTLYLPSSAFVRMITENKTDTWYIYMYKCRFENISQCRTFER